MKSTIIIFIGLFVIAGIILARSGPEQKRPAKISRGDFFAIFVERCEKKYQAKVSLKVSGETLWVYLPFTGTRIGLAEVKDQGNNHLGIDYYIASLNPFRPKPAGEPKTFAPCEITYVVQNILGDLRELSLRCFEPYQFVVLVATNVAYNESVEEWYIMYREDLNKYPVGMEFSGEALRRLTVYRTLVKDAYHDFAGKHVQYHDVSLKEFLEKQIGWRVYQKFVEEYNKTPFNLSSLEKREAVVDIVTNVINGYHFKEYDKFIFKDISAGNETVTVSRQDLDQFPRTGKVRGPAF